MSELFETVFADPFSLQPLREFNRMQRDMNRIMNQLGVNFPGVNFPGMGATNLGLPLGVQFQQPSLGGQLLPEGRTYLESQQGEPEFFTPLCDVYDMGDHLLIHMELAGVDPNDVNIEFTGKKLLISGIKREKITEPVGSRFKERNFGPFKRRLNIPKGVQEDQIRAKFEFGVLEIQVPKPHRETKVQGKRIPIVAKEGEKEGGLKSFKSETGEKILKGDVQEKSETAQTGKSGAEKPETEKLETKKPTEKSEKFEAEKPKQTKHEELIIVGKPTHFEQTGPDVAEEELKRAPGGMKIGMSTNQAARVHPEEGTKEGEKKEGASSKKKKGVKKGQERVDYPTLLQETKK